jgi:hypothetical protein
LHTFFYLYLLRTAKFVLFAKYVAHGIANFSQGSIRLNSVNNQWEKVLATRRASFQGAERLLHALIIAALPQRGQLCHLPFAQLRINM